MKTSMASISALLDLSRKWAQAAICPGLMICIMSLGIISAAAQDGGKSVYVKIADAKVRSGTRISADVVATLDKGTELAVLDTVGGRYKVALPGGGEGYISRLHVSTSPPESGGGGVLGGLGSSDVQADESDMVSSIRGVNPQTLDMVEDKTEAKKYAGWVRRMEDESAAVKDQEVDTFLNEKNIGF
ncbi:MAG: SH3 domain-containing protein [Candidatus Sumerlaeia bacterium]